MNESALKVISELYPKYGTELWRHVQWRLDRECGWQDCTFLAGIDSYDKGEYRVNPKCPLRASAPLGGVPTPVYCVPSDGVSSDGKNILWEHHKAPVPLADNCVLYSFPRGEVLA